MSTQNGTATAEKTQQSAYQQATDAHQTAIHTLLDTAADLRHQASATTGSQQEKLTNLARSLEQSANVLNSREPGQVDQPQTPVDETPWTALIVGFLIGLIVGYILKRR